jgi:LacI family transcriptional regulator
LRKRLHPQTVNLSDVADRARVSTASVSRVLNGALTVSADLRSRVKRAADELGYVPNGAARALSSRRWRAIGAVVPTVENTGFATAVAAVQRRLEDNGFTLLLASSEYDPTAELRAVRMLLSHGIDGIMLVGGEHHKDLAPLLQRSGVAVVETWTLVPDRPCVGFDNQLAARRLTECLLDLGHTEIGVIAGRTRNNDRASARVAGIRLALKNRGLKLETERLIERPYRILDGRLAMRALLSEKRSRPTAVICGNDQLAFGAMIEVVSKGLSVPADISIAGFNDLDFSAYLTPPLTTVRIPAEEIGRAAADYLMARIAGERALPVTEVPFSVVVRGSIGPPPRTGGQRRAAKRTA